MIIFGLLFGSGPLLFINFIEFFENVTCERGFTGVDMTDEDNVSILFFEDLKVGVLVLRPFSGEKFIKVDNGIKWPGNFFWFFLFSFSWDEDDIRFDFFGFEILFLVFFNSFILKKVIADGFFVEILKLFIIKFGA